VGWLLAVALILMVVLYAGVAPDVEMSRGQNWEKTAGYHYVNPAAEGESHTHGAEKAKEHESGSSHP